MSDNLPAHALDVQLDLFRYYTKDTYGRRYADTILQATMVDDDGHDLERPIEGMGIMLHEKILIGETYAVAEEIIDVLEHGAETIPEFVLELSDIPAPAGFVWLERPIVFPDRHDRTLVVRAFGWHVTKLRGNLEEDRSAIAEIAEVSPALAVAAELARREGREVMCCVVWTDPTDERDHLHAKYAEESMHDVTRAPHDLMSMIVGFWEIGRSEWYDLSSERFGKLVLTFLRFIEEPWVDYRQMVPHRHQRKRAVRTRRAEPQVHVVQLRRALSRGGKSGRGGGPPVEWDHRWLVRGHWRNQACGPGRKDRRPRYIPEHIKGPEDKPLVVHDKIFSVDR